jgi:4a-hydroxytetrahydrobiopterin dehydratase
MADLVQKKCLPCAKGSKPLKGAELQTYMKMLEEGWQLVDESRLKKEFNFKNFKEGMDFANEIAKVAEEEGHHPEILISWGSVILTYWTHAIHGLSESDFIMAAKSDVSYLSRKML